MVTREQELINLKTRTITIPAGISKTRLVKQVRQHFKLSHDEARHSFISCHVALHRSIGDAALEAGNSESIVRRHYLNLHPCEEGDAFFRIVPLPDQRKAEVGRPELGLSSEKLRAI